MKPLSAVRGSSGVLLAACALLGCNGSEEPTSRTSQGLAMETLRDLPTQQYGLVSEICPESAGVTDRRARAAMRQTGERQLRALIAALERGPAETVMTSATPAEGGGEVRERLTIEELARTQVDGLDTGVGARGQGCTTRARKRLLAALSR